MQRDFGRILARASTITWKTKILWVFGFLMAVITETGSYGSNLYNVINRMFLEGFSDATEHLPPELANLVTQIGRWDVRNAMAYVWIGLGCCLVAGLVLSVLALLLQSALIQGVLKSDEDQAVTFRGAWGLLHNYLGRLLGLFGVEVFIRILLAVGVSGVMLLLLFWSLSTTLSPAMVFLPVILIICPSYCALFILMLLLEFYLYIARLAVLVEDAKFRESFGRSVRFLRGAVGPVLLLGMITFGVGLAVGMIQILVGAPALVAFLAAFRPLIQKTGVVSMPLVYVAGILFLLTLPVNWLISGVWLTWRNAVYALVYRQWTSGTAAGKTPAAAP
jgi:hypothetical protein